jgi:TolB-like protein
MKKMMLFFFYFVIVAINIFGQGITLNRAINESAQYFIERINNLPQQRISVAVTNFGTESYSSQSDIMSEYIIDELIKYFINNSRFTMVDRQKLNEARRELYFNMSLDVSDETAQLIGRFIGAQVVIFGSIKPMGNVVRFQVRAIRVETAEILGIYTGNVRQNDITRIFGRQPKPPKSPKPTRPPREPFDVKPIGYLNIVNIGFGELIDYEFLWGVQGGILLGNYYNGFNFLFDLSGGFGAVGDKPGGSLHFGGIAEKRFAGLFLFGLGGGVGLNKAVSEEFYPYLRGTISVSIIEVFKIGIYFDYNFDYRYKIGFQVLGAPWVSTL